jgi:hypothetical protein
MKLFNIILLVFTMVQGSFMFAQNIKINIDSPSTEKNYMVGDTIWIIGNVVSDGPLHDVNIYVTDLNDSTAVYFNKNFHTHGSKQEFKRFYILGVTEKTMLRVIVRTYNHDEQMTARKQLVFKCNFPIENTKSKKKSKTKKVPKSSGKKLK